MYECAPAMHEEVGEVNPAELEVTLISNGLEFGRGSISGKDSEPEVLARMHETIRHSGEILVPIDKEDGRPIKDDGCGDGREVTLISRLHETFKKSLNRAKVFGGSAAMTAASIIGVGRAQGASLNEIFDSAIGTLIEKEMDFGAHTDEHAHDEDCGCGAIDRAPEAVGAALKYRAPIRKAINDLEADTSQLDTVYGNFRSYVRDDPSYAEPYSGRKVMERIKQAGKVVKRLGGDHHERCIILNTVRGYTVNQELIRQATGGQAQAFAVDIPRLEDIAANLFPDDATRQSQAYLSELIYTLAVAAVLTKGDLPVYMIKEALKPIKA